MEGAIVLLLFSGFLVFVVYRMDQNEHQERMMDKLKELRNYDVPEDSSVEFKAGFIAGMQWGSKEEQPIDITPMKAVRKRKK